MQYLPFILVAVMLAVAGQLLLKTGLNLLGNMSFSSGIVASYIKIFISPYVILGILAYFGSLCLWLYTLSKVNLSFAYPFVAISYVLVILSSRLILGETVPMLRWVGVMVICCGVILVSRS
jgi:drug/metabolite transporter (DMT)-like permease